MPTCVALLRGINVAGRARVSMSELRRVVEDLGPTSVRTYIQSGNVIFDASHGTPTEIAERIERTVAHDLGVTASVIVRTRKDLARLVAANPLATGNADASHLHVTFLDRRPRKDRAAALTVPPGEPDALALLGTEVYLRCPNDYGGTRVNNVFIERRLGVGATTRNWRTVTKLLELMNA